MTRQEALQGVAGHVAGSLLAGSLEEACGVDQADMRTMSDADVDRLAWAVEEIARRLRRMGRRSS